MTTPTILDCGHPPSPHSEHTTGYGTTADGKTHCWECCAKQDREYMVEHGKITLYLTQDKQGNHKVSNWPDSLRFPVWHVREGQHNIAGTRYDAWFHGPDGFVWHGVQYGDMTQLIHCKRTKEKTRGQAA